MTTKAKQLREASTDELHERAEELRSELFNLRFQKATGRLDNYKRLREIKRELARVLTVIRERELGITLRPSVEETAQKRRRRLFRRRPVVETEEPEEEREGTDEAEADNEDMPEESLGSNDNRAVDK
ncbi:MAG: 50S ribosomal protein L29 [Acidimicrobiia bacterium]